MQRLFGVPRTLGTQEPLHKKIQEKPQRPVGPGALEGGFHGLAALAPAGLEPLGGDERLQVLNRVQVGRQVRWWQDQHRQAACVFMAQRREHGKHHAEPRPLSAVEAMHRAAGMLQLLQLLHQGEGLLKSLPCCATQGRQGLGGVAAQHHHIAVRPRLIGVDPHHLGVVSGFLLGMAVDAAQCAACDGAVAGAFRMRSGDDLGQQLRGEGPQIHGLAVSPSVEPQAQPMPNRRCRRRQAASAMCAQTTGPAFAHRMTDHTVSRRRGHTMARVIPAKGKPDLKPTG